MAQGIVRQHAPDGAPRGRAVFGLKSIGDFNRQFTEAVATERHLPIRGAFARQCHDQCACGWLHRQRPTTARPILQSITPFDHKPSQPAADRGSTHPLLARQGAAAQTGGAAQDHACTSDQALWRCASAHPGRQCADFGSGQLD
jgi:hypothetical protein